MITILDRKKLNILAYSAPSSGHSFLNHSLNGIDLVKLFYKDKSLLIPLIGYNHEPFSSIDKGESIYTLPSALNYTNMHLHLTLEEDKVRVDGIGSGYIEESDDPISCFTPMGYLSEIVTLVFGKSKWLTQQFTNHLAHKDLTKVELCDIIHNIIFSLDEITVLSIDRDNVGLFLEEAEKNFSETFTKYWSWENISVFESIIYYDLDNVPVFSEDNLLGNPRERIIK